MERSFDALGKVSPGGRRPGPRDHELEWGGTGSLRKLVQPDGGRYVLDYDSDERLVAVVGPRGETYRLEHDAEGRVERERSFDGRTLRYAYSRAGRLRRVDYDDGTFRELSTDALGNVTAERSPHGSLKLERDALGRIDQGHGRRARRAHRDHRRARRARPRHARGDHVRSTAPRTRSRSTTRRGGSSSVACRTASSPATQYDALGAPSRVTHRARPTSSRATRWAAR
jgi:YD repeat-containing protein